MTQRLCMRLVAGALLLLASAAPLTAQERAIALERFDARIDVRADATIDVTETLRIRFDGSWNGIERDIWLDHETGSGRVTRLRLDLQSVTDESGNSLRREEDGISEGRRLRIWVPDAVDATRTVVIRYRVPKVIRFYEAGHPTGLHDELYWDVTGSAWEMPIGRASATVTLPAAVQDVQAWAYTGIVGSRASDASVQVVGNEVRVESNDSFAPREGLTVSVTWAPGVVARPGATEQALELAWRWWPLMLPFFAFFAMFGQWKKQGKDPEARAITVQYEPPTGLTAVEVGTLVDHSAEMHDITSILVDLAVRGYVVIEEREEKKLLGLVSSTEYWFLMRRPREDWRALADYEQRFLSGLFSKPTETAAGGQPGLSAVKLSDLENRFYKHLDAIRGAVYTSLIRRGLYAKRPDKARNNWFMAAVVLGVLAVPGAGWVSDHPAIADPFAIAIGLGIAAIIVAGFAMFMPTRTVAGARAREAALGFKEFLGRVEQDRFKRMITSPEQFERYLPFAMAFQVEERWAKAFEDLFRTPPDWYHGRPGSTFRTTQLARSMSTLSSTAGRTMSSSPRSSSGSGGGGFSGGGSGGGGGRGF